MIPGIPRAAPRCHNRGWSRRCAQRRINDSDIWLSNYKNLPWIRRLGHSPVLKARVLLLIATQQSLRIALRPVSRLLLLLYSTVYDFERPGSGCTSGLCMHVNSTRGVDVAPIRSYLWGCKNRVVWLLFLNISWKHDPTSRGKAATKAREGASTEVSHRIDMLYAMHANKGLSCTEERILFRGSI